MGGAEEFSAVVWGDSLGDWMGAAELVLAGVRTALIVPDSGSTSQPCFPGSVLPPASSEIIANRLGFSPQSEAEIPEEPDFQVVTPQHRIDFFGSDEEFRFGLERDVPEYAENIYDFFRELDNIGKDFETWLENAPGFPPLTSKQRLQWTLMSARAMPAKFHELLSETIERHEIPDSLQIVLEAPLNMFAPFQRRRLTSVQAACLWRFLRRTSRNGRPGEDIRSTLKDMISANGEMLDSPPVGAEFSGKIVKSIQLSDGRRVKFKALIARPGDFFSILDSDQREQRVAKKIAGFFPRYTYHTLFFRIERDAVPEAMARRVIFVLSIKKDLWADNLMLLSRFSRSPRWDTLAVTLGYPKGDMEPPVTDYVFESLRSIMPFLQSGQIEVDVTLSIKSRKFYLLAAGPASDLELDMPIKNLYLSFSEILPRFGPIGLFLAARGLADMLK